MTTRVDDIIFLLSTDCFSGELLCGFADPDIETVKTTAREVIPQILQGGDNYYLHADFSPARAAKTRQDFFASLKARLVPPGVQQTIQLFDQTLLGSTDAFITACHVIGSVAARMYWLDSDDFNAPLTLELVNIIADIEPLGLHRQPNEYEWQDVWLNSASCWDRYVMSLMDGIDEVPYLTFSKIKKHTTSFDFLSTWKKHLGEARFSPLQRFIHLQAHAQLDDTNPAAANEIDRILFSL